MSGRMVWVAANLTYQEPLLKLQREAGTVRRGLQGRG